VANAKASQHVLKLRGQLAWRSTRAPRFSGAVRWPQGRRDPVCSAVHSDAISRVAACCYSADQAKPQGRRDRVYWQSAATRSAWWPAGNPQTRPKRCTALSELISVDDE
jgi:hypothetical protein